MKDYLKEKVKRVNICGININNISFEKAIEEIETLIRNDLEGFVVTPNIDHIVRLYVDNNLSGCRNMLFHCLSMFVEHQLVAICPIHPTDNQ